MKSATMFKGEPKWSWTPYVVCLWEKTFNKTRTDRSKVHLSGSNFRDLPIPTDFGKGEGELHKMPLARADILEF